MDATIEIIDEAEDIIELVEEGLEIVGDLRITNSDESFDVTVSTGTEPLVLDDTPVQVLDENSQPLGTGDVPSVAGGTVQITTPPKNVRVKNSDLSFDETYSSANSPATLADITITLKDSAGTSMGTTNVPSAISTDVEAPDVTYTDSDGVPVTQPAAVPIVCTPPTPASTASHIKTGATANGGAGAGDDGTTRSGRLVNWYTLVAPNIFGNYNRFTDTLGLQLYANGIMIDHSTWMEDGETLLGIYRTTGAGTYNVASIIAYGLTLNVGGYAVWRPINKTEGNGLMNHSLGYVMTYSPLNLVAGLYYWTGTPYVQDGGSSYYLLFSDGQIQARPHVQAFNRLMVRTFTKAELLP